MWNSFINRCQLYSCYKCKYAHFAPEWNLHSMLSTVQQGGEDEDGRGERQRRDGRKPLMKIV